jgi:branched-chain amino acid aminotransferase
MSANAGSPGPIVVNVNGRIFDRNEADTQAAGRISVFDRGYLYGDSLYEVCRTYGGRLFAMKEHLERMERSAALCHMTLSQPLSEYADQMRKTVDAFHRTSGKQGSKAEAYCRIIVSRGTGKIGFGLRCLESPTQYAVIAQPLEEPTAAQFEKGATLQVSARIRNDRRALDPAMKSGNYLNSLLAYLEANQADFDDAILCDFDGHVTEGTTFNVGYIRRGILATPPLDVGILDGITRRRLLAHAREIGLRVREIRFPKERMYEADEVFLCSTIREAFPVTRLDDRRIGDGKPGPWTRKLQKAFRESALRELEKGSK